jgi:hypothetical protein
MGVFTYNGEETGPEPPCDWIIGILRPDVILPSVRRTESSPKVPTTKFGIYVLGPPVTQDPHQRRGVWGPYLRHCLHNCVVLFFFVPFRIWQCINI